MIIQCEMENSAIYRLSIPEVNHGLWYKKEEGPSPTHTEELLKNSNRFRRNDQF